MFAYLPAYTKKKLKMRIHVWWCYSTK
jgi:hypothetical protein